MRHPLPAGGRNAALFARFNDSACNNPDRASELAFVILRTDGSQFFFLAILKAVVPRFPNSSTNHGAANSVG
jgi:hypothetical protein